MHRGSTVLGPRSTVQGSTAPRTALAPGQPRLPAHLVQTLGDGPQDSLYRTFLPINMTLDLQPHLNHNKIGLLHLADLKSPQSARHSWEIDLRRLHSPNSENLGELQPNAPREKGGQPGQAGGTPESSWPVDEQKPACVPSNVRGSLSSIGPRMVSSSDLDQDEQVDLSAAWRSPWPWSVTWRRRKGAALPSCALLSPHWLQS
ncbi:hypothetical protein M430DRAFT_23402 [Amorphotheca resinae ATCC 22711]|uniref:Uncharacterized protein n=1 Tax=Amorphotheca resinae ATCC 22711 TaxID=857342 RepID=A0A2T3AP49_AMORE|nr:hypothetical protein M430DRAFT_23402 [Amorphotheca resinae ATCC 22711]PSS06707.1 hypothetical protein M430DRAFT_23402 [Amorphotheca resinae ATCC 22711]